MGKEVVKRRQKTIGSSVTYSGIGIHTGQEVGIRLLPAKEGTGVVFKRVDLQEAPLIPAGVEYVVDTARGTTLAIGDAKIHTVEHLLAAIRAHEVDNVLIEIAGIEPPAGNGSSDIFVELLEQAQIVEQTAFVPIATLKNPLWWSCKESHMVALPSDEFRVSYTLHYPDSAMLKSQYYSFALSAKGFDEQIAPCRTFALYEELSYLMDKGLIRGGSLENAVVVQADALISKGGLYFQDEAVRHKVLDVIGDLSLVGIPFCAHIIAIRSGHAANCAFARLLYQHLSSENGS